MSNDFKEKGYCVVKSAISPELRDFVTQYALFDEMQTEFRGDDQVPNAHSKYADPAMETMLIHIQDIMEKNTGLSLYPTYSYYRVYRNGDDLKVHTDRPSCEISCTLCFNYSYDDKTFQWPIFMDGKAVVLNPGDLVIYRGCELSHWRDKLICNDDVWQVQGFFHYVDANGPYPDHRFDKRPTLGINNKKKKTKLIKSYIEYTGE